jgi:hypothetical protein
MTDGRSRRPRFAASRPHQPRRACFNPIEFTEVLSEGDEQSRSRPHGRPRGLAYARSDAGRSASAASGTTNEFSSRVSSSLIRAAAPR